MNYTNEALIPVSPGMPEEKHLHRTFQGIASIACIPSGRLFAVWYAGGDTECRENYVLLSISDDEGKTWTPAAVVDPPHPDVRAYDSQMWYSPDGKFRWFWAQGCGGDSGTWDIQDGAGGVFESIIENPDAAIGEFRFSTPRRISDGVMMNKPTVFSDGSWVYPVCVWDIATVEHPDMQLQPGCRMCISTDMGETLTCRGSVDFSQMPCGPDETGEHNFAERQDGSIAVWGRAFNGMAESISLDGGATWSDPVRPTTFTMTNSRMCIRRLPSGKLLQIYNDARGEWPERYTMRTNLTARLSDDDGRTWQGSLMLDDRELVAYPDADIMPDGSICIIYDRDRQGAGEILFARITEADILAGKLVSPKSCLQWVIDHSGGLTQDRRQEVPSLN